jgi:hypothetical protein
LARRLGSGARPPSHSTNNHQFISFHAHIEPFPLMDGTIVAVRVHRDHRKTEAGGNHPRDREQAGPRRHPALPIVGCPRSECISAQRTGIVVQHYGSAGSKVQWPPRSPARQAGLFSVVQGPGGSLALQLIPPDSISSVGASPGAAARDARFDSWLRLPKLAECRSSVCVSAWPLIGRASLNPACHPRPQSHPRGRAGFTRSSTTASASWPGAIPWESG